MVSCTDATGDGRASGRCVTSVVTLAARSSSSARSSFTLTRPAPGLLCSLRHATSADVSAFFKISARLRSGSCSSVAGFLVREGASVYNALSAGSGGQGGIRETLSHASKSYPASGRRRNVRFPERAERVGRRTNASQQPIVKRTESYKRRAERRGSRRHTGSD